MLKRIIIALSILTPLLGWTQIQLGNDTVFCGNLTKSLEVNTSGLITTNSYSVSPIPFNPESFAGTLVALGDDDHQGPFQIGFDFCFFGNTFSEFYIGSNGWVSFSPNQPTAYLTTTIPNPSPQVPKNCIMAPWQDWKPSDGGEIRYETIGTKPNRKLVISYFEIPLFSCTSDKGTFQIVLHENGFIIDNFIQDKPPCAWANGTSVQGLHGPNGANAFVVPGRNGTTWTTTNDAYRFSPDGTVSSGDIEWKDLNGNLLNTGNTFQVNLDSSLSMVVSVNDCRSNEYGDTIHLTQLDVDVSWTNALCYGGSHSEVKVTPTTNDISLDYFLTNTKGDTVGRLFSQNAPFNVNGLKAGTYYLSTKWPDKCSFSDTIIITQPDSISLIIDYQKEICDKNNGYIHATAFGGSGSLDFIWNTGDSVPELNQLDSGYYSLTVVDTNGCSKFFDVYFPHTPRPDAYFDLDRDSVSILNSSVNFTFLGTGGNSHYWDFNDGTISTELNPTHRFSSTGNFLVTLVVENEEGCADFYYRSVRVYEADIFIPNAFRPNGDGRNDEFKVTFRGSEPQGEFSMRIFDRWGKMVFKSYDPLLGWDGNHHQSGLRMTEGVYAYRVIIELENGEVLKTGGSITLLH